MFWTSEDDVGDALARRRRSRDGHELSIDGPDSSTQCVPPCQVAITVPGDNSVDIFTNDVGIVVISDQAGAVLGYNLLVGGGMGRTARWVL